MSSLQGRAYAAFRRALERKNLLVAEATAKELPPLSLTDALDVTMLIARKDTNESVISHRQNDVLRVLRS